MKLRNVLSVLVTASLPLAAEAADEHGHNHVDAAPINANGPQRRPDGSVFLPKPAQRHIVVRTTIAEEQELPRSLELNGRIVMDPNAGGKVQAMQSGRVQAGPRGLPVTGQTVRRGELLAYVVPSATQIELSNQAAQLADLRASRALAEKRLERLRQLADTVPRKEIDAAESELVSLTGRVAAVGAGLSSRETLIAPVSGVIASSNVVAGQIVETRELIFEIVDPTRLQIEAMAFDGDIGSNIGAGYLTIGEQNVPLVFLGAARRLREQALPLMFRGEAAALAKLAVGQPVKVIAQTRSKLKGVALPAASVLKSPSNQTIVWVKTAPEQFSPRVVAIESLDGTSVVVTSGLKAGDRVVTRGASLINQIR